MARPTTAPRLRAETRRFVETMVAKGCRVIVTPDGAIHIDPPQPQPSGDPFDAVDFSR